MAASLEPLEFEFTITREDAVNTNALFTRSRRRKVALAFAAFFVLGVILFLLAPQPESSVLLIVAAAAILFELTPAAVWVMVRLNESALRVGTQLKVTLKPEGIFVASAGLAAQYEWPAVSVVLEDAKAIVLLQGKAPLLMIAKRALASPTAFQDVKEYVHRGAPSAEWRTE
jgi:YcxB-like protein